MSFVQYPFTAHGDFIKLTVQTPTVTPNTVVVGSASEVDGNGNPQIGSATVGLNNVAPGNGIVQLVAVVSWSGDLNCRVSLAIFD